MSRFIFFLALAAYAQTPDTATIHGRVTDQSRAAVAQVQIKITNTLTGFERAVQTGDSGDFTLAGLPIAGAYTVVANKTGFAEAKLDNVDARWRHHRRGRSAIERRRRAEPRSPSPAWPAKSARMRRNWAIVWTRSRWKRLRCSNAASPICRC